MACKCSKKVIIPPNSATVKYLNDTNDPIALYNFDGNTLDESGNGLDLAVDSGVITYADIVPGKRALTMRTTRLIGPASALYQVTGDVTVMGIIQIDGIFTSGTIAGFGGATDSEADNVLYDARVATDTWPYTQDWFHESGAGVNQSFAGPVTAGSVVLPPVHNIIFVGYTRASNVITLNINGKTVGTSGVLAAATGGTNGRFYVGAGQFPTTNFFIGLLMSIKLVGRAYTQADFAAESAYSLGTP